MAFARPDRRVWPAALLLGLAMPAQAAGAPTLPPPGPLVLPASAPLIEASIAGQPVRLTVDFGGEPIVLLGPAAAARLRLADPLRTGGGTVERGVYRVAVGQTMTSLPFSRETLDIAGMAIAARVLTLAAPPAGQAAGSDGVIGLPLLPHRQVTLVQRPAAPGDHAVRRPILTGRNSNVLVVAWPLPGSRDPIEVELAPLRPRSVASAAAASHLAQAGGGGLTGPVQRIEIGFGVSRPVRTLALGTPLAIMGAQLSRVDVRLFDWAGRSTLPPDADGAEGSIVTGRRGRQRGWPILKLGADVLAPCASISWERRKPGTRAADGWLELTCPG